MMILYGCLFYIFIIILGTFDPTSIKFTLYSYLREQKAPPPEMQTHANDSMTSSQATQFMQKKAHPCQKSLPPRRRD